MTWGVERFVAAGLDGPSPDSVTFTRYSDFCEDVVGRVWMHDDDRDVFLWMRDHLTDQQRNAFTASVGLSEWSDADLPRPQQAREHAAETIAWGLMDRDMTLVEIGSPATDVLADRFRQLTGVDPIR